MAPMVSGSLPSLDYAMGGVMRGSMSRANDHSPLVFVAIGGVHYATGRAVAAQKVDNETLQITEREGETPNTCGFRVRGFTPSDGQDVVITLGSKNNLDRLFAGTILTDAHGYVGSPANGNDTVSVIDYTWQLTRRTITRRWTNVSGTVIARAIIALAPGFTSRYVAEGLPVLDEFTVTNLTLAQALSALCKRMGAYFKPTYNKDVRLGIATDTSQTDPTTLTPASTLLTEMTALAVTRDLSQVITRQCAEGGGVNALTQIEPGETVLPVEDVAWYEPAGGIVVSGPQRLTYTSADAGGVGTILGPGAAPSVALVGTPVVGVGLGLGVYQYAYTDVTAAGESLPSPLRAVTTLGPVANPTAAPTCADYVNGGTFNSFTPIGEAQHFVYTYSTKVSLSDYSEQTLPSPASALHTTVSNSDPFNPTRSAPVRVTVPYSTNPVVKTILIFLLSTESGGVVYRACFGVANNSAGGSVTCDTAGTTGTSQAAPSSNTSAEGRQVALSGISIGATGTTSRKVYRTVVGGTQLKLQQTIANNTATVGVQDATADGSLGANAPTSDTSGLTQSYGQVNAGSTSLLTSGLGSWPTSGGWLVTPDGNLVRYTGVTDNTLTGIPATGVGAILSSLFYGDVLALAPTLRGIPATGVGSILYRINKGDPVNLRVEVNDFVAQAAVAALMLPLVDDGVIEGAVIQDGRISATEGRARCNAQLALSGAITVGLGYTTHDKNTHAGRTIGVNIPAAPTSTVGSFKLQQVTISNFQPARWPTYVAVASSSRFTLEDLLRKAA